MFHHWCKSSYQTRINDEAPYRGVQSEDDESSPLLMLFQGICEVHWVVREYEITYQWLTVLSHRSMCGETLSSFPSRKQILSCS